MITLLLAGSGGACSGGGPPAIAAERLAHAPVPAELPGLDPAAVALVRRTAAELEAELESPARWTQLGVVLQAHERFELAVTCYEQRLLRDEADARTWYLLATAEEELDHSAQALEHLARCAELDARYPPAHWRRGYLLLARGELAGAEEAMQAALALAPHDAAASVGLARVRLQQRDPAAAAALLEGHLARLPRDGNARFLLGTAYRELGRLAEAERALAGGTGGEPVRSDPWQAEVLAQRQGYRSDFLAAVEQLERGELTPAIAGLEALRARRPEDTLVLLNLHKAYRKQGELERAIALLLEARRLDPLLDMVHLHLAGAYREQARRAGGEPDRNTLAAALESARTACELAPTYADAHGMRGDVLADLGRTDEALAAWLQAAELARESPLWQERAALALCQAGRWREAVPRLRKLDALQPRQPRVLLHLAAALANSGELEAARLPLEQARLLAPEDAAIRKALADLERSRVGAPAARDGG